MAHTVGRFGSEPESPPSVDEMIERVQLWHREHAAWVIRGSGLPPSWPLEYNETAELVLALEAERDALTGQLREAERVMGDYVLRQTVPHIPRLTS